MPRLGLGATITNAIKIGFAALAAVITSGLAMWHKFTASTLDGTPRLPDDSANTNEGSLYTGRGFSFDGVNDSIDISGFTASGNVFSFSFYAKLDGAGSDNTILDITPRRFIISFYGNVAGKFEIFDGATWKQFGDYPTDNDWHYYTVVANNTTATAYIDGAQSGSPVTIVACNFSAATTGRFGSFNTGLASFFPGDIANFKIFNIALTSTQVTELYQNPEQILPTGATAANLVGWWPLTDSAASGIALDGSGNGNHGTISGATAVNSLPSPVSQVGLMGSNSPMWFDGTDDYIALGSGASLEITGDLTVSGWFIIDSYSNQDVLFAMGGPTETEADNILYYITLTTSEGLFYLHEYSTGTNMSSDFGGTTGLWSTGNLFHFALIRDNTAKTVKVFINGSQVGSTYTYSFSPTGGSTGDLNIFKYSTGTALPKGTCLSFAVLNTDITTDELTEIYNGGLSFDLTTDSGNYASSANLVGYWINTGNQNADWLDLSGNGNNGTVNGSPLTTILPEGTTANQDIMGNAITNANTGELILYGTGYTQVADDATLDITSAITLEAWVKPFTVASTQTIIGKTGAYALKIDSSGKPSFSRWSGASETATATTATALSADTWYHIAVTYDGANVKLYIDGVLDTTTPVTGAIDATTNNLIIGGLTTGTELFNGYIEDARIYNTDLSAANISNNYSVGRSTT